MKKIVLICIICLFPFISDARNSVPLFTFGAEWSYVATIFSGYHYNYFSPEGYRFNVYGSGIDFYNNGEVLLHVGYNIDRHWNIAAYAGMSGLADYHNSIPINLRFTRYFGNDFLADRWFSFIDLGTGLTMKIPVQSVLSAKIGGGYRVSLSRDTKLDLLVAVRNTYTQPQVYHDKEVIGLEYTNRNDAYLLSLSFGASITF